MVLEHCRVKIVFKKEIAVEVWGKGEGRIEDGTHALLVIVDVDEIWICVSQYPVCPPESTLIYEMLFVSKRRISANISASLLFFVCFKKCKLQNLHP